MADAKLIFDIGAHHGEDTEFYLKKGFRVVGVEANPIIAASLAERFASQISAGRFILVNKAISDRKGVATFYQDSEVSEFGTLNQEWVDRNRRPGSSVREHQVETITIAELIEQFGTPYYAKIDIEGHDMIAVEGFRQARTRPSFISIESEKVSFQALRNEFTVLQSLGYTEFALSNQFRVPSARSPNPAREGVAVAHDFAFGSSGLFGQELPGPWMSADQAIDAYKPIFLRYALTGDDPYVRSYRIREVLRRMGFRADWYDTHARLPSVN